MVIKGYGELHLEIMKDRLRSEYGIDSFLSKLRVALRECIRGNHSVSKAIEKKIKDSVRYFDISLEISAVEEEDQRKVEAGQEAVEVMERKINIYLAEKNILELSFFKSDMAASFYREYREGKRLGLTDREKTKYRNPQENGEAKTVKIDDVPEPTYSIAAMDFELIYALESVLVNAFSRGPIMGKHLSNTRINVVDGRFSRTKTNDIIVSMVTNMAVLEGLKAGSASLMEPLMKIEIQTPESYSQDLINDLLSARNGKVLDVSAVTTHKKTKDNVRTTIIGTVPLYKMIGYSTFLRTVTSVSN